MSKRMYRAHFCICNKLYCSSNDEASPSTFRVDTEAAAALILLVLEMYAMYIQWMAQAETSAPHAKGPESMQALPLEAVLRTKEPWTSIMRTNLLEARRARMAAGGTDPLSCWTLTAMQGRRRRPGRSARWSVERARALLVPYL